MLLDDLVGDPPESPLEVVGVDQFALGGCGRHGHSCSFPASRGAV
jgi:hypothetical protein